jgi:transposase, IS5 family
VSKRRQINNSTQESSRSERMRVSFDPQGRLDCNAVLDVSLNLNCRDEIVPILKALQHIYSEGQVREEILGAVEQDVNNATSRRRGRKGMDYWQILVLAAVRLGCNLNYDKLQDLAEQHRALRQVMGIGDWEQDVTFDWRRIRNNVCQIRPATIERINRAVVAAGHRLTPEAVEQVRVDSSVVETNIHYPTEGSLIHDGLRKILTLCARLANAMDFSGWRQHKHLEKKAKKIVRDINRVAARKGANYQDRLRSGYEALLQHAETILDRAAELREKTAVSADLEVIAWKAELATFMQRTEQVCNTARRRVLNGEQVPNADKLFSIFEPHTQLYKRGKAGEPIQFGRLVMIYEDAAGFIVHYHLLDRDSNDKDVAVEQTRLAQERLDHRIQQISFDRGFHTPDNQRELAKLVSGVCLPKPGAKQAAKQAETESVAFHRARQNHPGVEAAIGALQSGNGLKRCRDRSEPGFDRYLGLGILGRNLHVLGKLLIAQENADCKAAYSKRRAA